MTIDAKRFLNVFWSNQLMAEGKEKKSGGSDTIEIPVGTYFNKLRGNPWMLASIVLGVLLVLVLAFGGNGTNVSVSESQVKENVVSFLNSKVSGEVEVESVTQENGLYKIVVVYQGEKVPVYVTLDGENLVSDLIPLEESIYEIDNSGVNTGERVEVNVGDSPVKGNPDAPITIVEFSDYQCPFCAKFYTETLPLIEQNYVASGKVKLVFMDFPLSFHPDAASAAESARCVGELGGNDAYFAMHDLLFENQQDLSEENLKALASSLGYDISECLESGKFSADVQADLAYGQSFGVSGTPAFFINGVRLEGALPYSAFQQVIEAELQNNL